MHIKGVDKLFKKSFRFFLKLFLFYKGKQYYSGLGKEYLDEIFEVKWYNLKNQLSHYLL